MAGATAFFATFALPPIIMITVRTLGLFMNKRALGHSVMNALQQIFGTESVNSFIHTIRSFRALEGNYLIATGIFLFLLFVATSLFTVIRNAINQLWCIRTLPDKSILAILKKRAISVAIILAGGLLFLAIQVLLAGQQLLGQRMNMVSPAMSIFVSTIINTLVTTAIAFIWLYMLFMILPDGKPDAGIARMGAAVVSILFTVGKIVLKLLLRPVQVDSFYGATGAIALVLLFMFYSSIFLYFGAALIHTLSTARGKQITPKTYAESYRLTIEAVHS